MGRTLPVAESREQFPGHGTRVGTDRDCGRGQLTSTKVCSREHQPQFVSAARRLRKSNVLMFVETC